MAGMCVQSVQERADCSAYCVAEYSDRERLACQDTLALAFSPTLVSIPWCNYIITRTFHEVDA